jgi:hypothetical protein
MSYLSLNIRDLRVISGQVFIIFDVREDLVLQSFDIGLFIIS